jgi:hypothetical protein
MKEKIYQINQILEGFSDKVVDLDLAWKDQWKLLSTVDKLEDSINELEFLIEKSV